MSDSATETRRGFQIGSRFYPVVGIEAWTNGDFVLARELTRLTAEQLFDDETDYLTFRQAMVAIAVAHERRSWKLERVIEFVYGLRPADVSDVGLEADDEEDATPGEDDAGPPDEEGEAQPSSSPTTSGEDSDAEPASS